MIRYLLATLAILTRLTIHGIATMTGRARVGLKQIKTED